MGLVGLAHCVSHFSQLLLPPLFPWLKDAFHVSYAELGVLLTVFFVVSCAVQAVSGFVVDRFGPRPILFGGIALLAAAAFGFAASTSYAMLVLLRGRRRHRQRRLPSGRLHAAQPQGPHVAARPCVQRARHHRQPGLGAGAGPAGADRAGVQLARRARECRRARAGRAGGADAEPLAACTIETASTAARAPARRARSAAARRQPRLPAHSRGVDVLRLLLPLRRRPRRRAGVRARGGAPAARRAGALGGDVPDLLHGRERRRHGDRRLSRRRSVALREDRRRRLRHRRRDRADDRLRAARADGGAGAVRADGRRLRNGRAVARPASSSAPRPKARPVASTASSTRASTSARRSRRSCSAR